MIHYDFKTWSEWFNADFSEDCLDFTNIWCQLCHPMVKNAVAQRWDDPKSLWNRVIRVIGRKWVTMKMVSHQLAYDHNYLCNSKVIYG